MRNVSYRLNVKANIENIPIRYNIFFALQAQFAMLARLGHATQRHQIVIGNRFGADKTLL